MPVIYRTYIQFTLLLLVAALVLGILSTFAFLYPEVYNKFLPFYQLRPLHVSAAIFWILSGAVAGIMHYKNEVFAEEGRKKTCEKAFMLIWMASVVAVFISYAFKQFGGREYWEFPPVLGVPVLLGWLLFAGCYFSQWYRSKAPKPAYVWMWSTGVFFFALTFLEQNLWQVPWFRQSFLKEITVQWKANGSMVGAWNQMIYGTLLYIMVKISGNADLARGKKVFFFYFLGLANLMFNWGHHIYNVPGASWIRHLSYAVSMTEVLFLVNIIAGFKKLLDDQKKVQHRITYRFFVAAEFWVLANLVLVLFMSVPAVNRYTHGTHITVAHAMVATIGINSMILQGSIGYMLKIDEQAENLKRIINKAFWLSQASLMLFWLSLVTAGVIKGYRSVAVGMTNFQEVMQPVLAVLKIFAATGIVLAAGLGTIALCYIKVSRTGKAHK